MRMLQCEIDGNVATPVASGFDGKQIKEIVDNGPGDYTIILKRPFSPSNANKAKAFVQVLEPDRIAYISAVDYDRVTVTILDVAGVAADASFSIMILGCNHRFNY